MMDKYERFVASYLRLNGYFTVPNFIVHAADDAARISDDRVGNLTETDILGVRMPHSHEVTGPLHIANDPALVSGASGKFDVVVAEVKSGKGNTPNPIWHGPGAAEAAAYIARFVGLHSRENEVRAVGNALAAKFRFEDDRSRFRYIMFSRAPNSHYQKKGMSVITFEQAISFIVEVRGECWVRADIGVASSHHQWDELLVEIFEIANEHGKSVATRVRDIQSLLAA